MGMSTAVLEKRDLKLNDLLTHFQLDVGTT